MSVKALAPWFGANRMLASNAGRELAGCSWVGVPFAGGMAELEHIDARTILVNDLHRHVINLARVATNEAARSMLIRRLQRKLFHPDELTWSQEISAGIEPHGLCDIEAAENYFVCCWMSRSGMAGTKSEFKGKPAIRWHSDGGDSNVRFRSAIRYLASFHRFAKRCTFETMDAFDMLDRCHDRAGCGLYLDPPFPKAGRSYRHNGGKDEAEERAWQTRLRDAVKRFSTTRIVMRFYDHPLIRELYPANGWTWRTLVGRKQTNDEVPEVLIVNGPPIEEVK